MKRLLVIAAGFLQTFLIKKAKELGYYVIAIDGNPTAEGFKYADESACINITDPQACIDYAISKNIDGVLTAASDYGVISASEVAKVLNLPGINPQTARLIKNKYLVRKCLFENKVDDTEQAYEINAQTDIAELSEKLSYPVMVKPCDGSGSRGASRVDFSKDLKSACGYAMSGSLTGRAVIESFITGREYGVESFVIDGKLYVLGVMKKWMTKAPNYAELGHAIPSQLPAIIEQKVINCAKDALKALGVNFGSVNMDVLVTDEGHVHIVDVGARMGGNLIGSHIIPLGTGIDYMANIIRAAVGDPINMAAQKKSQVATKLLALTPGKVAYLPDFEAIEKEYDVIVEHHLSIGDTITPYRTNLDGCGYIVAKDIDVNHAESRAAKVLEFIDNNIGRE